MATTTVSDFKIYHAEFWAGMNEILQQNTNVFNGASLNTVRMTSGANIGDYRKEAFLKALSNGAQSYRDPTDVATSLTPVKVEMGEHVGVKVRGRIGPVETTLDSWRTVGDDLSTFSFLLGQQTAQGIQEFMLNAAVKAMTATIAENAGTTLNIAALSAFTELDYDALARALQLMGDKQGRLLSWLGHSQSGNDILREAISSGYSIESVVGAAIASASVPTLNRPFVMTDSPDLASTVESRPAHTVFGLVQDAVDVRMVDTSAIDLLPVHNKPNLIYNLQGEYSFMLEIKGYAWKVGSGRPTEAADLSTAANWEKVATSDKDTAGIAIIHHDRGEGIAS